MAPTMLDPFAQLFQHCWGHARSLRMDYKDLWTYPTMHCRSQHCWELLHPFAHLCQHARNNSQHCWRNNVGICCARLHTALERYSSEDFRALYFPILYWRPFLSKTVAVKTARNIMNFQFKFAFSTIAFYF